MLLLLHSSDMDLSWFDTQLCECLFRKLGQISKNKDCRVITIIVFLLSHWCKWVVQRREWNRLLSVALVPSLAPVHWGSHILFVLRHQTVGMIQQLVGCDVTITKLQTSHHLELWYDVCFKDQDLLGWHGWLHLVCHMRTKCLLWFWKSYSLSDELHGIKLPKVPEA